MSSSTAIEPTTQNGNAVAKQPTTIKGWLASDMLKAEIAKALPKHCSVDRMMRIAITAVTRTPKLAECEPASFLKCMMDLSQWGLEPNGRDAHLIPFNNRRRGVVECQLILDYKGLVQLLYRSGQILSVHADVVYEGDDFAYSMGELLRHTQFDLRTQAKPAERGKMIAAYARIVLKGGACKCEVMTKEQIDGIRKRSKSGNDGPWVTDYEEMAKKGLAIDTPIPTPEGWTSMGELGVGDIVFDMHGSQTEVIAVSEVKYLPCFRLTFGNGEQIICDDEHRWAATIGSNGSRHRGNGWPVHTVNELFDAKSRGESVSIPVAEPIDCDWRDLPIHPWAMGYWLGNGRTDGGNVTCNSNDQSEVEKCYAELGGYLIGAVRPDRRSNATAVGLKGLKVALREVGVLGDKHIPADYLRGTREQREFLLCGLMDSDGHIDRSRGRAIFASTNKRLAEQVHELVVSLGETAVISSREQSGYGKVVLCYRVEWQPSFCPCLLTRKAANYRPRKIAQYRAVSSIERIATVPTRCIAVASESKTYLAGRSMIPTHNTVFRRATKWLPLSAEIIQAFERDDDRPANLFGGGIIVDTDFVVPPTSLNQLADRRKEQADSETEPGETIAHDDEIATDPESLTALKDKIALAMDPASIEAIRTASVGPESPHAADQWDVIDNWCDARLAELKPKAKGQKDLIDRGSELPE